MKKKYSEVKASHSYGEKTENERVDTTHDTNQINDTGNIYLGVREERILLFHT